MRRLARWAAVSMWCVLIPLAVIVGAAVWVLLMFEDEVRYPLERWGRR